MRKKVASKLIETKQFRKNEKEVIELRYNATSKVVHEEIFQCVTKEWTDIDRETITDGYLLIGISKSFKVYSTNGNKPILIPSPSPAHHAPPPYSTKPIRLQRLSSSAQVQKPQSRGLEPDPGHKSLVSETEEPGPGPIRRPECSSVEPVYAKSVPRNQEEDRSERTRFVRRGNSSVYPKLVDLKNSSSGPTSCIPRAQKRKFCGIT